ncbi:ferredoxin-NAD reductase [Rhodanobacter glycinis]|uniref:Ferredoxin-NAD reductase n=1 Tax=Rhodanobacter glycinis TaxID=582702 RepID=A0A5B9E0N9_9GAMM|nr:FAD-dependent oxidoreductase [Rhodanobacter glycinis]QEE24040.1 ferredoxin-NAD reductase [Rhodanobacter glycinis]
MNTFVIIGAGQAGAWVARSLRNSAFKGRIVLIGDEDAAPYERPPLSKEVLKGEPLPDSCTVLKHEAAAEAEVELWLGESVKRIDREAHLVLCASGREITYDKLFIATGSRVRMLPTTGLPQDRVFYLRTLHDAERLHQAMMRSQRVLIVGGGWIGLEVAAVARGMGKQVTVIEMAPRLCARAAPPAVSDYLQNLHARHGVDVYLDTRATLSWDGSKLEADTGNGKAPIAADMVVIAAGIVPNVELATECGLAVDNGIVVDDQGRTSDPDIFAAGDVTNHPNRHAGMRLRLESWENAQNQAIAAAHAALELDGCYDEIPWFWSDQYDVNLQILGMPPADIEPVRRGNPADGKCLWLFWRNGRIASVIAVNSPREIRVVKKWMLADRFPEPSAVLDESLPLQKLSIAE